MDVDDAEWSDIDDALGNDLAVADYDHRFGRESPKMGDGLGMTDLFGLPDFEAMPDCRGFYRGWRKSLMAAFWAVGLRDHFDDVVTGRDQCIERWDCEVWCAQENQIHNGRR